MSNPLPPRQALSAVLCAILFSATCVLSAVGPAGAVSAHTPRAAIGTLA
jgi:hypothetical protein